MIIYLLKEDLKELWSYRRDGYARRSWFGWYRRAMRSPIESLKAFVRKLRGYLPGLLAHCRSPPPAHQRTRGHQQQDQAHQADGLRLP